MRKLAVEQGIRLSCSLLSIYGQDVFIYICDEQQAIIKRDDRTLIAVGPISD